MSRDGPASKQVWLPSSGVWAVLPERPAETEERTGISGQNRRHSSRTGQQQRGDRRPKTSAPRSRAADNGGSRGQLEQTGAPQEAQPASGVAGAAPPPGASGGASPTPSCQAAPPASGYTGFELQHSDLEASDVEEVEPAPTCPICECSSSASGSPPPPPKSLPARCYRHHRTVTRSHCSGAPAATFFAPINSPLRCLCRPDRHN